MRSLTFLLVIFFLMTSFSYGAQLKELKIEGYESEIISDSQIRFIKKESKLRIHIQKDQFNHAWSEKTFNKDSEQMIKSRLNIYEALGFSAVKFDKPKLTEVNNHQAVILSGTYNSMSDTKIFFYEVNIYFKKNFLQIKMLDEKERITDENFKEFVTKINLSTLEIE
jgi:hypothetical protein